MFAFAISDKGGTGRSVTSGNVAYRAALAGADVCYLDFDFGSPTVGSIFQIGSLAQGLRPDHPGPGTPNPSRRSGRPATSVREAGLHQYLLGRASHARAFNVWAASERPSLRSMPAGAGQLVLYPGDHGHAEFPVGENEVRRCAELFATLVDQYELIIVDLSAGRSFAAELVLRATRTEKLRNEAQRWLVFHRWTRQHIDAANGLVVETKGLADLAVEHGWDRQTFLDSVYYVRAAFIDPASPALAGLRPTQVAWLTAAHQELRERALRVNAGRSRRLGSVPLDPLLQWREQLISDNDVHARRIANPETIEAFEKIVRALVPERPGPAR